MIYLAVAHFDENSEIEESLARFINLLSKENFFVHLISTKLDLKKTDSLSKEIKITVRENVGYDFYSYSLGMQDYYMNEEKYESVILMNSSFKIFNPSKIYDFFKICTSNHTKKVDLLALTESYENHYHCQSFLLRLGNDLLSNKSIKKWWLNMKPISNRQKVIDKYEIGFTKFVVKNKFITAGVFNVDLNRKIEAMNLYYSLYQKNSCYRMLNPCHFLSEALYQDFGIVKHELLKKNPHNINLKFLSS